VKRQYRQLALAVHPDKCGHARAKEAFQRLSEAFDRLASEAGQRRCLAELARARAGGGQQQRGAHAQKQGSAGGRGRWWDTQTWEEFERRFRHRDAAEASLRQEFTKGVKARHSQRRVRAQVLAAERSTEHCDRNVDLPESELWPPESRLAAGAAEQQLQEWLGDDPSRAESFRERPELDDPSAALARLLDLLTHLRTVHRYCLYCGCVFDSFEDLERNCPGFTEEEHENAPNPAARTSQETALEPAGQVEAFEEDPLDSFMAGMQEQLVKDLKSSATSERKRDQTRRGWTFAQQEQQNRNESKRMKRGR